MPNKKDEKKTTAAPAEVKAEVKVEETAAVAEKKAEAKKPAAKKSAAKKPAASKTAAKKPTEKKTAAKKPAASKTAAKKPAEKKTAASKTATKKPAAKKTPAKSIKPDEVKIQCNGDFTVEQIAEKCVEAYKGNSKKKVQSISIYLKAENGGIRAYYVINGKSEGLYIDL